MGRLRRSWPIVLLVVLAAWGLIQCLSNLDANNTSGDEPTYLYSGLQYLHGNFVPNREHPPLAKYLIGASQLIFGDGKVAARLVTGALTYAVGWVLFVWLRKEIGLVWAIVAAGSWWLLPRIMPGVGVRIDRLGVLEPFMVGFAVVSIALAWCWFRRGRWWFAALSGMFMALSVTSKVSSALLVLSFVYLAVRRKEVARGIRAVVIYACAFAATFVAVYLPAGMVDGIRYMITFQAQQRSLGHPTTVNGVLYPHTPWWSNLAFTVNGLGLFLCIALLIAMVFAYLPRPSELSVYVGVCVAILLVFYCLIAGNALSYYYYAWVWAMIVLAAIGLSNLSRIGRSELRRRATASRHAVGAAPSRRVVGRSLALLFTGVVLVTIVINAGVTTVDIRHERPTGFALASKAILSRGQKDTWILNSGYANWQYAPYLSTVSYVHPWIDEDHTIAPAPKPWNAVAVLPDQKIEHSEIGAFLTKNRAHLELVHLDYVDLYIPKDGRQISSTGGSLILDPRDPTRKPLGNTP